MLYEDIYGLFYILIDDPTLFNSYPKDYIYAKMNLWLNKAIGEPYIEDIFSSISMNNEIHRLQFELKNPIEKNKDYEFVRLIFAEYLHISWLEQKINDVVNTANIIGGKEEKKILSNYKSNIEYCDSLKTSLKKRISNYGYNHNDYFGDEN